LKKKIIFDSSVLVSGYTAGNLYKTGLFRFSSEILKQLEKYSEIEIYLFDIFHRERELQKYVQKKFPFCKRINVYSGIYRSFIFPLGNFVDRLRKIEKINSKIYLRKTAGILKNFLLLIEKSARKIERSFLIKKRLSKELKKYECYFSTYFPMPVEIQTISDIRKVYTIHDLIPMIYPHFFSSPFNEKLLKEVVYNINIDDKVITVSESTKKDLFKFREDLLDKNVIVAQLAASDKFFKVIQNEKIETIRLKYQLTNKPYILSVCTMEPRKNLQILISAYQEILKEVKNFNVNLVLVGSSGWETEIFMEEINSINKVYKNRISLTGFVPDFDLAALYSGAHFFVYPSLYEGFGLPVLEAMKCGLPVICSNTSSLPEVAGDAAIMIDPTNKSELISSILKLCKDDNLRIDMAKKSINNAVEFNWENTASKIIEAFA
jgi:glycosyltransferase involved in cell wall biosynthesis